MWCTNDDFWQQKAGHDIPPNLIDSRNDYPELNWFQFYVMMSDPEQIKPLSILLDGQTKTTIYIHQNNTLYHIIESSILALDQPLTTFDIIFHLNLQLRFPSEYVLEYLNTRLTNNWNEIVNPTLNFLSKGDTLSISAGFISVPVSSELPTKQIVADSLSTAQDLAKMVFTSPTVIKDVGTPVKTPLIIDSFVPSFVLAEKGKRSTMEDGHIIVSYLICNRSLKIDIYAVFDGHGGSYLADILSQPHGLAQNIAIALNTIENIRNSDLIVSTLRQVFMNTDEAIYNSIDLYDIDDEESMVGSTAVMAVVIQDDVYMVNLGDSRGMIFNGADIQLITTDHKPTTIKEQIRLLNLKHTVMFGRVDGTLSVSRSFGDYYFDRGDGYAYNNKVILADPDVYHLNLAALRQKKEGTYMILSSDGFWDVITKHECVDLIRARVKTKNLSAICHELVKIALKNGTTDNMTILLVKL